MELTLKWLRESGWRVAVHNDYMLDGQLWTFWLFTNPTTMRYVKGEGRTDADALRSCVAAVRQEL